MGLFSPGNFTLHAYNNKNFFTNNVYRLPRYEVEDYNNNNIFIIRTHMQWYKI